MRQGPTKELPSRASCGESNHDILWILVIYPLFIILFSVTSQKLMNVVINSLPLDESSRQVVGDDGHPNEKSTTLDLDYSTSSNVSTTDPPTDRMNEFETVQKPTDAAEPTPLSSSADKPQGHPTKQQERQADDNHKSRIVQASILHILVVVMTHRLGMVATRRVQETKDVVEKVLGLLTLSVAIFFAVLSGGKLEHGRVLWGQGYRVSNDDGSLMHGKDALTAFVVISFFSFAIPWVRLLIA
ncbi:hypothetical protein LTR84_009692 [Exophiala bonariae]|uniref:Uncharacterized protein n=1 Tax=Exophiala bonariae TaxID=1690606 RepID=A0AAV9NK54_9EURO|nr:hypothetical protein LTR84_009692 [Exophiala bonariae]